MRKVAFGFSFKSISLEIDYRYLSITIIYLYNENGLEVTFGTAPQNRKHQMPSSDLHAHTHTRAHLCDSSSVRQSLIFFFPEMKMLPLWWKKTINHDLPGLFLLPDVFEPTVKISQVPWLTQ